MRRVPATLLCFALAAWVCCGEAAVPEHIEAYVRELSGELGVEPELCLAILVQENPGFDQKAVHHNGNGTSDIGLWQLNDLYLWTTFMGYWRFDHEFDAMNWRHSTYIALHHIRYLVREFKGDFDLIVCAYNCGATAVMKGRIPESTYGYLEKVRGIYDGLKK